jgi:hypothetical protein
MNSASTILCHRCGELLTPGEGNFYVVRIEAVADPAPPNLDSDEPLRDTASEWDHLMQQMREMSEQELLDQVYRRLTLHLCAGCYRWWIENPTG